MLVAVLALQSEADVLVQVRQCPEWEIRGHDR